MRFSYNTYRAKPCPADRSAVVHEPSLLVRVIGGRGEPGFLLWGKLDTAAAMYVLPHRYANLIQPNWIEGEWPLADYAGVQHSVRYGAVDLQIRLEKQRVRWFAVVAFDRDRDGTALWGMAHFLEHFRVTFDGPEKHFTVRLRDPVPWAFRSTVCPAARGPRPPIAWNEQILDVAAPPMGRRGGQSDWPHTVRRLSRPWQWTWGGPEVTILTSTRSGIPQRGPSSWLVIGSSTSERL